MEESLVHPAHEHALIRRDLWKRCRVHCPLCWSDFGGRQAYCCLDCGLFLHESCASVETPIEIHHPFHSHHPLILDLYDQGNYVYRCTGCKFSLNPLDAIATLHPVPQVTAEIPEIFQHVIHKHALTSFYTKATLRTTCLFCDEKITQGVFYGCSEGCSWSLVHVECLQMPVEILQHPFHPQHPLTLRVRKDKFSSYPSYGCDDCGVTFQMKYIASTRASQDQDARIQHFSHQHDLSSFYYKNTKSYLFCAVCKGGLSGESRYCSECHFYVHPSCLEELPREISYHLHPKHPLVVGEPRHDDDGRFSSPWCSVCRETATTGIVFSCESCKYCIHPSCALPTLSAIKEEGVAAEIQHSAHAHPLSLHFYYFDMGLQAKKCRACLKVVQGLTYSCTQCRNFDIHRSCTELPLELQHPVHPPHPLLLNMSPREASSCSVCDGELKGFSYDCTECRSYFHIICATKAHIVKHHRHEHLLTHLSSGLTQDLLCNSCGKGYGGGNQRFYRCTLSCNFKLHEYCLLDLPRTIQHECHPYHRLELMEKFVEGDPNYQYCDLCEEIRNPDHGVYRCAREECWYTVHIDCVVLPKEVLGDSLLIELDKKIASLDIKIHDLSRELEALREERWTLQNERDNELSLPRRMTCGLFITERREDDGEE